MISAPNIIAVMNSAMTVALLTSVSNAYLARIQQPPPWAALIKQAVKGFVSGIFIRILQCLDNLINPSGLDENVVCQRISGVAVPLGEGAKGDHTHAQQDRQDCCHFTRLTYAKSPPESISIQRLPAALMMTARACLR